MQDLSWRVKRFAAAPTPICKRPSIAYKRPHRMQGPTMTRQGRGHRNAGRAARPERAPDPGAALLWGAHSVEAALTNPRRKCRRLFATEAGFARVAAAASQNGVRVERVGDDELTRRLTKDAVHQGLLLEAEALPRAGLDEVVLDAPAGQRLVVILDQITDPHNLGAILRSSAGFGALAVVVQERHSPPLGGTVLELPGGGVVKGADPAEQARRELAEECGIAADDVQHLTTIVAFGGAVDAKMHIYLARDLRQVPSAGRDRHEFIEVVPMAYEELLSKVVAGELIDAPLVVATLLVRQRGLA